MRLLSETLKKLNDSKLLTSGVICYDLWQFFFLSQQRAREVVEWRSYMEEQDKMKEDQQAIEAKQKQHQDSYKKDRESMAHLSWRQRRAALYRANKHKLSHRVSEKTEIEELTLPIIIKGEVIDPLLQEELDLFYNQKIDKENFHSI